MGTCDIDGVELAYELIGDAGPAWVLTPGGRFSKDKPGVREMAAALAERGNCVLIWDRPNCGASSLCFEGESESVMQADHLAALLRELDLAPAIIGGGSAGARVSLLTAARHPDVAQALAMWWLSGGTYGLMTLACYYCGPSIAAAWASGMDAVAELDIWQEPLDRNPANRHKLVDQDPAVFVETFERWMRAYYPHDHEVVPGLSLEAARAIDLPTLVYRNGSNDPNHTRAASERAAEVLPRAELKELPWPDDGLLERKAAESGFGALFTLWPDLVPGLHEWAIANTP